MEEKDRGGLKSQIADEVIKRIVESQQKKGKSKEKKFLKLKKISPAQLKKGYVNYILLRRNGYIDLLKAQVEDGAVFLKEARTFHKAEGMHIWNYKGKIPVIIQPEWSVEPLSITSVDESSGRSGNEAIDRDKLAETTAKKGMNVDAQKFIIKKAEEFAAGLKPKKQISSTWLIYAIIGIVVIFVISLLTGKPII